MALVKLQTQHFRNLSSAPVSFSPSFNLLYGENGSGKTSVLEAIAYLGLGRSFRVSRHQAVVSHGEQRFTVFGGLDRGLDGEPGRDRSGIAHRVGIARDVGQKETTLRVDGESVRSLSSLAMHLPVSVIDPGVFDIVAGGPGKRRQFLDWAVFHVEPSFAGIWQQCQRVTSQRNQTLRNGRLDEALLRVWDTQYTGLSERISEARQTTFDRFKTAFETLVREVDVGWTQGLKLEFYPGWDTSQSLVDILANHREQERRMGHTLYGPNRADIRLKFQGRPVSETFSRGQQKTLVILMKIAQGMVLSGLGKQVTFLLDDINAELDVGHRAMLARKLQALRCQVFITSIEHPEPGVLWPAGDAPEYRMFHVEHGKLTEE
ncbi:DNA replication/repair protein RecF [Marinobacter sp. M216]|uniref:DNA replication and repair protein RecF n=1 Tax=Marinobacter albus TaxID=3030833 RepID=A0ABT7HD87_9GAMM|nr:MULTISPECIES: DNA replication/repair protein RecF [unclassified Marinobacter]MBW7471755.1 DNA replication/repair protein RecF [Marinobacter sp. F4218]MDK9558324.1 DNA replication/repair protein RecF [Marinobacter sp. M216]